MVRRLVNCSDCGLQHKHRGRAACRYAEQAKVTAVSLGGSEEDFKLHLDTVLIERDNTAYLYGEGEEPEGDPDPPPENPELPPAVAAEFHEFQKKLIQGAQERIKMNEAIDRMTSSFDRLSARLGTETPSPAWMSYTVILYQDQFVLTSKEIIIL